MKQIKVSVSDEGLTLMNEAAAFEEIPISIWLRNVGLTQARSIAHRKLCMTKKTEEPRWAGRPCTKEYMEEQQALADARQAKADAEYDKQQRERLQQAP